MLLIHVIIKLICGELPSYTSAYSIVPRIKQIFKDLWGGEKKTAGAAGGLFLFNRSWKEIWLILRCHCGCPNFLFGHALTGGYLSGTILSEQ